MIPRLILSLALIATSTAFRCNRKVKSEGHELRTDGCSIETKTDLDEKAPIFYNGSQLFLPTNGYFFLKRNEKVQIACPGVGLVYDTFASGSRISANIKCIGDKTFEIFGIQAHISSIRCNRKVTGSTKIIPKMNDCPGTYLRIGFQATTDIFVSLLYACVKVNSYNVMYTYHRIFGSELSYQSNISSAEYFQKSTSLSQDNPSFYYALGYQKSYFRNLLGDNFAKSMDCFYLEKVQMTPRDDQILGTWQRTYETYGMLQLPKDDGKMVEISLDNIRVPKYVWKVAKSKETAIAFVVSNNPFEEEDNIWGDDSESYGWEERKFSQIAFGKVHICTVDELKEVFQMISV